MGMIHEVRDDALVPDGSRSIREGAIASWPNGWQAKNLRSILDSLGYNIDAPWDSLAEEDRKWILFTDEQPSVPIFMGLNAEQRREAIAAGTEPAYTGTYTSARKYLLQSYSGGKDSVKKRLSRFITVAPCHECQGKRLNQNALAYTFAGHDIAEMGELTITQLKALLLPFAEGRSRQISSEAAVREAVIRMTTDICGRLDQLEKLGLGHLSLGRRTTMLSSGELQRIRLATQLISRLFGVIYVLDEPAAGLHPEDVRALLQSLRLLLEAGNSLVIVEHNLDVIAEADWLTEIGPGPGRLGGEIVYNGPPSGLRQISRSPTAGYLFDKHRPGLRQRRLPEHWLKLEQVTSNNIHGLDVGIPLERMTVITGVSGSGKSTLLARVLPTLLQRLDKTPKDEDNEEESLVPDVQGHITAGGTSLKRLVSIDQRPIGRTPRSNLATYTGFFDTVRKLFAETDEAKKRGFDASRFSFNLPAGRCSACEGQGQITIELMFMPQASAVLCLRRTSLQ